MSINAKYHTTSEVAKQFSVTIDTVRRWIKSGQLRAVNINGYWRVSDEALTEFADKKFKEMG